jgi:hypothetical protein
MSDREQFIYDVRVRDRFVAEGVITRADVERHLAALADAADKSEEVDLEQPALSKEPDESTPVAPMLEAAPTPGAAISSFGDVTRQTPAAIPAIAAAGAPAPAHFEPPAPAPAEPVPAIAPEPVSAIPTASDPHAPASVPPPTASVDADWGDS